MSAGVFKPPFPGDFLYLSQTEPSEKEMEKLPGCTQTTYKIIYSDEQFWLV